MRGSWRQLQSLQLEAMAYRGVLRNCVRGLTTSGAAGAKSRAQFSEHFAVKRWNDGVLVSEQSSFGFSRVCGAGVGCSAASAQIGPRSILCSFVPSGVIKAQPSVLSRVCSAGRTSRSSTSAEKLDSGPWSRLRVVHFSTFPVEGQSSSEVVHAEGLGSAETVVTESTVSVEEFVPVIENVPSTPLVQEIKSQKSSRDSKLPESLDEFFASLPPPPKRSPPVFSPDADRIVQPGRLYVGGLPFAVKGEELREGLREMCSKYGTVMDVAVAQHRHQSYMSTDLGKHRGYAFVTMETPEQAQDVIEKLNGASAWGRVIMVSYGLKKIEPEGDRFGSKATPAQRCKVFVGNLHEGTSQSDLVNRFQEYGTIKEAKLITELHSSRSRGFGFITFTEEGQAMKAILDLDGSTLDGSVIRVNIAKYPQSY